MARIPCDPSKQGLPMAQVFRAPHYPPNTAEARHTAETWGNGS